MEPLTYEYGKTPEPVIRERLADLPASKHADSRGTQIVLGADDFIAVVANLARETKRTIEGFAKANSGEVLEPEFTTTGQLRMKLLALIDIKEG